MEGPKKFNFPLVKGRLSEKQRGQFYREMKDVVVNVEVWVEAEDEYDCEGGGVFISPNGLVLTLLDVLLNQKGEVIKKLRVISNNGDKYQANVMLTREDLGLAVLSISSSTGFPYAQICTDELEIGEEVYPIGHPGYLDFSFPVGHISFPCREYDELTKSLRKDLVDSDLLEERANSNFKFDVSAKSICYVDDLRCLDGLSSVCFVMVNNVHGDGRDGAKGMPFFNNRGEIIGMYFLSAYDQCYGIHAKTLYSMTRGEVPRPWLGLELSDLDTLELGELEKLIHSSPTALSGVLVRKVDLRSPASDAGICTDDIIIQIDGKHVGSSSQFTSVLLDKAKDPMEVIVKRAHNIAPLTLTVLPQSIKKLNRWPLPEECRIHIPC